MLRIKQHFCCVTARLIHTPVAKCYDGQSVFITGGTGFLGKVLIEKILYSCPGINKVYLLVRENQEHNIHQRTQRMLDNTLFSRLKCSNPQALEKIVPVAGDITKDQLGMNNEDIQMLQDKVSIVFHSAATVKFDERLDVSTELNINGTLRVLNLCHSMKNIKSFVHVSTAFVNRNSDVLEEKLYPPTISVTKLKEMLQAGITGDQLKKLLEGGPNTYTFTKALAESLVAEQHGDISTTIIRPSAITCSISEPIAGWLDTWFALNTILMMIGRGWTRCLLTKPEHVYDLIPVDYVANLMIVAAAKCNSKNGVEVYNCTSSTDNPLTSEHFVDCIVRDSIKNKIYDYPPHVHFTSSKAVFNLATCIFESLPANISDLYLMMKGKKVRYKKIEEKMNIVRNVLEYFTTRNWSMPATRTIALFKSLSPADREIFPFDPRSFNWDEYMPLLCEGVRKYLLKK